MHVRANGIKLLLVGLTVRGAGNPGKPTDTLQDDWKIGGQPGVKGSAVKFM